MAPPQTTAQKVVRHTLRWATPLLVLAALGGTTMDGMFAAGRIWSMGRPADAIESPDHHYRAYIFLNDEGGHSASVVVQHHWHRIYLGGFLALATYDPVNRIAVKWSGPNALLIRCDECVRDRTDLADMNWGRLHLSYDLGRGAR